MPNTSTKRRFEFVAGTSDKFWEVSVKGNEVLVCFGPTAPMANAARRALLTKPPRKSTPIS